MSAKLPTLVTAFCMLAPMALLSQPAREHDVTRLKNWPAPLYWQPEVAAAPDAAPEAADSLPSTAAPLVFVAMSPCRVVDTRTGQGFTGAFGPPSIAAGLPVRTFPIQTSAACSIPAAAQAYSFNVTVVPPGGLLYLTLYPANPGTPPTPPNASTLNDPTGTIVANAAIVPAGTDGAGGVDVFASSATDLIVDINGYYAAVTTIQLGPGAAGATAFGFSGDPGTGLYSSSTGIVNLSAGGTQALTVGNPNDVTALGVGALGSDTTGGHNVAVGSGALGSNTTGGANTAVGHFALGANTTGGGNTSIGGLSLTANTTGANNTAAGQWALMGNTIGGNNTAVGQAAMQANTTGTNNTAVGINALNANTTGPSNTAMGSSAMFLNSTGTNNTALGYNALYNNNSNGNTAIGYGAMQSNTTGFQNVALGLGALTNNIGGNLNLALGFNAATNLAGGNSYNIIIGNHGTSTDNGVIRIGTSPGTGVTNAQTSFFAAGIRGTTTGNSDAIPVMIDSNGQLGTVSSSARFKEDIRDMGDASSGLLRLRPVTFRYQKPFADGLKPVQYGLIAEEVEKVYPDLVAHSADGQIESVKYQALDSMLLNEIQKQAEEIRSLKDELAAMRALLAQMPVR